nr:hypothetical protein Itr_chr12CG24810 [Ipomoea trifida]
MCHYLHGISNQSQSFASITCISNNPIYYPNFIVQILPCKKLHNNFVYYNALSYIFYIQHISF